MSDTADGALLNSALVYDVCTTWISRRNGRDWQISIIFQLPDRDAVPYFYGGPFEMQKLTQKLVDNFALPQQKQLILRDTELRGFGLRSTPGGKSYIVEARINGKSKRITVCRADLMTLDEARRKAIGLLAQMTSGIDPQEEKEKKEAAAITFAEVLNHYLSQSRLKPSYKKSLRGSMSRYLGAWLNKPIASITQDIVQQRHNEIGQHAPICANTAIRQFGTLANYAINHFGLGIHNPVAPMYKNRAWFKQKRSPAIVLDDQLPAFYRAVMSLKRIEVRDFFLLIALTGLRRGEALALRWEHVDFDLRTLKIPSETAKNSNEHILPLSTFLLALLTQRKQARGASDWVFPRVDMPERHMSVPQDSNTIAVMRAGFSFSPHGLRRTFCTLASRMNTPHHIVRRLLNHSQTPDLTSQYIIIGPEAMREPMEKINEKLLELMNCNPQVWLQSYPTVSKIAFTTPTLADLMRRYFLKKNCDYYQRKTMRSPFE